MSKTKAKFLSVSSVIFVLLPLLLQVYNVKGLPFNAAFIVVGFQFLIFCVNLAINFKKIIPSFRSLEWTTKMKLIIFIYLIVFTTFSILFSDSVLRALKLLLLIFGTSLMLVFLVLINADLKFTFNNLLKSIAIISFISSLHALLLYIWGYRVILDQTIMAIDMGNFRLAQVVMGDIQMLRLSGPFYNPNTLGLITALGIISTIYLLSIFISKLNFTNSLLCVGLLIPQFIAIYFSRSRASLMTCIIFITMFGFIVIVKSSLNFMKKFKIIVIITIIILVGFAILTLVLKVDIFKRSMAGLSGRDVLWSKLIERIKDSPIKGVGFGLSTELILSEFNFGAHNVYLKTWSEIGLFGFLMFILLWFFSIFNAFNQCRKGSQSKSRQYYVIFSVLSGLLFHQIFEVNILVYNYIMFLWIFLVFYQSPEHKLVNVEEKNEK